MFSSLWLDRTFLWLWDSLLPNLGITYNVQDLVHDTHCMFLKIILARHTASQVLRSTPLTPPNHSTPPLFTSHYSILTLLMCTAARRRLTDIACVQFRLKQPIKPVIWEPKKRYIYIYSTIRFFTVFWRLSWLYIFVFRIFTWHVFFPKWWKTLLDWFGAWTCWWGLFVLLIWLFSVQWIGRFGFSQFLNLTLAIAKGLPWFAHGKSPVVVVYFWQHVPLCPSPTGGDEGMQEMRLWVSWLPI